MIGIGVNIRPFLNKVARAAADYYNRITADGGVSESPDCVNSGMSDLDRQNLLNSSSLLLIPSGYKGGKLYSQIPTNGNGDLTWTRGSDAFRTNASGVIQRVPWNLLQYSEQFDDVWWSKDKVTISANATTSPNGTATADLFVETTQNGAHSANNYLLSLASGSYTFSVYAKAKERSKILVFTNGSTSKGYGFDLANGTMSAVGGVTSSDSYSITNVGDGWYRCTITNSSTTVTGIGVYLLQNFSGYTYTGDGTSGLFFWGAQLVEGTTAQTYLPTTDRLNFPRLSYMYGSCPSALLEPQRTNLCLYSSAVGGTGWTMTFAGVGLTPTVTTNYAVAPDGTTSASRLQVSLNGGTTTLDQSLVTQTLTGTSCRGSFYIKTNDGSTKTIYVRGSLAYSIVIDGTWKRYDFDAGTLSTTQFGIGLRGGQTPTNSNTADILVWGAQLEVGAYPTTYIPTTSATATRIADSAFKTGIGSLIGQTEGTVFLDFIFKASDSNVGGQIGISDSAKSNRVILWNNSSFNSLAIQLKANNSNAIAVSLGTFVDGTRYKIAIAYKSGDTVVYVNGTQTITNSASFTFSSSLTDFILGGYETTMTSGHQFCFKTALFTSRLTNAELATLTT